MGVRGSAIVNVIDHIKLNIKSNFLSIYYLLEESKKKKKKKKMIIETMVYLFLYIRGYTQKTTIVGNAKPVRNLKTMKRAYSFNQ
jgi:hypothetical protein